MAPWHQKSYVAFKALERAEIVVNINLIMYMRQRFTRLRTLML